jgi:predicted nucleic acid-binding Zn ribbon protein
LQQSFPCPKCGNQIPVGQYFCSACGQRFEYRCHACGTPISGSSGFCSNCGKKLTNMPQHAPAPSIKSEPTHHRRAATMEHTPQHRVGAIGRYLIIVAVIFLMVGIVYAVGSSTQGDSSSWMSGYSFGGQAPPTTPPPATEGIVTQQDPKTAPDSPSYTMSKVIELARQFSPDCRLQTRRTG